jgi:hypothetical protein
MKTLLVLILLASTACQQPAEPTPKPATKPTPPAPSVVYKLDRNGYLSDVTVKTLKNSMEIFLTGGGDGADGAAAAGSCHILAKGILAGNTLKARFIPFESDIFSYTPQDATRKKRYVTVIFKGDTLEITQADTVGHCGLNAYFEGTYQLHRKT